MAFFIQQRFTLFILIAIPLIFVQFNVSGQETSIHTVQGPIEISELGFALTHEHVMSNFGKALDSTSVYAENELFGQVIPYLKQLKILGVDAIFDCTTAYFGRRVDLLKTISDSSGIHIITNTGIYGGANDRYIPKFAYENDASFISRIWIDEFENGIEKTGIKPGFIKLAFDAGTPSEIDRKLFEAGLLTHLKTGLTLAVHTADNLEAVQLQLKLLEKYRVHPSAWVWVHANKHNDDAELLATASKGAWISLDGANASNLEEYIAKIQKFKANGLLHKILLSHDGNGFPAGRTIRKFDAVIKELIPALLAKGLSKKEIDQIMTQNPRDAFAISIRSYK